MYSYYFAICSFCFCILLMFAYFHKKRFKGPDNIFYTGLIIATLIGLLCEFTSAHIVLTVEISTESIIYQIVVKAIYAIYLFWITFLCLYFVSLIHIKRKTQMLSVQFVLVVMSILNIATILLPLDTVQLGGIPQPIGVYVLVTYIFAFIYITTMLIISLINKKYITSRERVPLIFAAIVFFANLLLQFVFQLYLTYSLATFVAFIMYFTIQNPDIKMYEEAEIEKEHADEANKAKSNFLSSMSHEIRTPLNAIVGFSEGLKDEQLAASAQEAVNDIISASQTLLETVNGILDISKIEANKIEIINSTYDFDETFNELVSLSKARLGNTKPIEFKYQKSEDVPKYLYGDCTRLKQIIVNLLTNAIKYTKKGYILFDVSCINTDDNCKLKISVKDTGMGIKEKNICKLFTKFERLDNEDSGIEGTGLGLAITKKLVELMNGEISVESKYGVGSTFTVVVDQKISDKPVETEKEKADQIVIEHDLSNKKVLVVDDNTLNLKVSRNLLKAYNIVPIELVSGIECLDLIKKGNTYDLILIDDLMPEKSGKETLKELKQIPNFNIPVVILTANAIDGMKEEYLALGFDDYLSKPIDKEQLKLVLKKFLDK